MPIIRIKKHIRDFLTVDKTPFRDDNRLTWGAKGILVFLLCLPDNWEFNRKELSNHAKDGITTLDTGLKILKEYGYYYPVPIKDNKGKFRGYEYNISELPNPDWLESENLKNDPESIKPKSVLPDSVFTTSLLNKDIIQYIKKHKKEVLNILEVKEKKKRTSGIFHSDSEGGKLAQYFLDQIEIHNPSFPNPDLALWEKAFNSMIYVINIPAEEIKQVIFYTQNSMYWKAFINNPYKLKAKYETLKIQLKERNKIKRKNDDKKNVFQRAKEEHIRKINNKK